MNELKTVAFDSGNNLDKRDGLKWKRAVINPI